LTLTPLTILDYNIHYLVLSLIRTVCSSLYSYLSLSVWCPFTSLLVPASNGGRSLPGFPNNPHPTVTLFLAHSAISIFWNSLFLSRSVFTGALTNNWLLELCSRATWTSSVLSVYNSGDQLETSRHPNRKHCFFSFSIIGCCKILQQLHNLQLVKQSQDPWSYFSQ
jgi:hypothetical protein